MDYINRAKGERAVGSRYVFRLLKDSRVLRLLRSLGYTSIHPSISPVNTFRTLFNLYFGAHFRLLADETRDSSLEGAFDDTAE